MPLSQPQVLFTHSQCHRCISNRGRALGMVVTGNCAKQWQSHWNVPSQEAQEDRPDNNRALHHHRGTINPSSCPSAILQSGAAPRGTGHQSLLYCTIKHCAHLWQCINNSNHVVPWAKQHFISKEIVLSLPVNVQSLPWEGFAHLLPLQPP